MAAIWNTIIKNMVYDSGNVAVKRIKPTIKDFVTFREIAFSSISKLTLLERVKVRLGFSPLSLLSSRFLFNKFYIAEKDNQILGFAIFRFKLLRGLFVSSEFRENGVGSRMLNKIMTDTEFDDIYVKPTKSSRSFYLAHGFYGDSSTEFFIRRRKWK